MSNFSTPSFYNEPLQSGFWSTKSTKELLSERKNKMMEYNENASESNIIVSIEIVVSTFTVE